MQTLLHFIKEVVGIISVRAFHHVHLLIYSYGCGYSGKPNSLKIFFRAISHINLKLLLASFREKTTGDWILLSLAILEYNELVMILFKGHVFVKQRGIVTWLLIWNWKVRLSFCLFSLASNVTLTNSIRPHLFNHQVVDIDP